MTETREAFARRQFEFLLARGHSREEAESRLAAAGLPRPATDAEGPEGDALARRLRAQQSTLGRSFPAVEGAALGFRRDVAAALAPVWQSYRGIAVHFALVTVFAAPDLRAAAVCRDVPGLRCRPAWADPLGADLVGWCGVAAGVAAARRGRLPAAATCASPGRTEDRSRPLAVACAAARPPCRRALGRLRDRLRPGSPSRRHGATGSARRRRRLRTRMAR